MFTQSTCDVPACGLCEKYAMFAFREVKQKSTIGVCQIVKALLQESFRGWKSKMNVKMTSFLENSSKNSFGLPNQAWEAALGKGFQGLLLQERLLQAVL